MKNLNDISIFKQFKDCFNGIKDNRQKSKVEHLLSEILFMSTLAIISGADTVVDITEYSRQKKSWLATFLKLPKGIPSHDTFNRVLCMINPTEFENCFRDWMSCYSQQLVQTPELDVIPIDGKVIRGSANKNDAKKAIHMVSALSTKHGVILGQQKCDEKSNEITAIPMLIEAICVAGTIITIDAMGTQKKIAKKIIQKEADYILAVKSNQPMLMEEIIEMFDRVELPEFEKYIDSKDVQIDKGHGRIEQRECIVIRDLGWLTETTKWEKINAIVKIVSTVIKNEVETKDVRYYITSTKLNASQMNCAIRNHWHIENKLHWVLDVVFCDDLSRIRTGFGAQNLSTIKRMAYNAFKIDKTKDVSMRQKRKIAMWSNSYALTITSYIFK